MKQCGERQAFMLALAAVSTVIPYVQVATQGVVPTRIANG